LATYDWKNTAADVRRKIFTNLFSTVQVDGVKLVEVSDHKCQGIAILNIPSVYGGTNLWGSTKKKAKNKDPGGFKDLKYAAQGILV